MSGKVLITGGLGNLGSYITKEFCESGYDVYVLVREENNKLENVRYTVIKADITNIDALKNKLNIEFDYCIHLASFNEFFTNDYPKKALEINTLGTRNLLEVLSQKHLKRFIYFSTFHVYGTSDGIVNELSALNPKNDYASTHLFAEYYVKQFGLLNELNYTIFRLSNSYGAPLFRDTNKWYLILNDLVKSAYENNKIVIKSNGKAFRDFIWVQDVVTITKKALDLNESDIYNLSSSKSYQLIEIANIIKIEYEKRYSKTIEISVNSDDTISYKNLTVSNAKLKNAMDFDLSVKFIQEINAIFQLLESSG
jgi:UDP-glucose 4-epimerase